MSFTEHLESSREQTNTVERLSLKHGDAEVFLYRSQGVRGVIARASFEDGYATNIDEDGRLHG